MKAIKNIVVILFAAIYLIVSVGVILVSTDCSCSAKQCCSIPETSDETLGESKIVTDDFTETAGNYVFDSKDTKKQCNCCDPVVNFIKLGNHFGTEVSQSLVQNSIALIHYFIEIENLSTSDIEEVAPDIRHYSPPENHFSGRILVNYLNQRKIALSA